MATNHAFGEHIQDKRQAMGLSLRVLAPQAGISPSYLCDLERGARRPTERVCRALAPLIGDTPDDLMDLGCILGRDVERWLRRHPAAIALMQTIARLNLSDEQLNDLILKVEAMKCE